ncbi:MAG TPA: acetolactate synthase small subunit [Alphaproteobacteria bacterium]|nr:acetolactate synthase small subunit [Alphaproteobacteria bacterium]
MTAPSPAIQRHVFSVLVNDEPGVLARVIGLFSGRGYNIESLTVANVDPEKALSRITIVSSGTPQILEQIEAQLNRIVPVRKVVDLTREGPVVEREMALVKVNGKGDKRMEALKVAEAARAVSRDASPDAFIFEITGAPEQIDDFINLMRPLGLVEVVRSGVLGLSRGGKVA